VGAAMWSISYHQSGEAGLRLARTLPLAVNEALRLIDQGASVSRIEGSGGLKGMNTDEIRAAYAARKAKKSPPDARPTSI
jgi:hypothetical protein